MIKCFLKNKKEINNIRETLTKDIENVPIEGEYDKIDLSEDEDENKDENKDENNKSYSNLDKILNEKENKIEMEIEDKQNDINFNPFNLKYCKPCAICYFFPSDIFHEKFILLEKVNEEIKNKNKMFKFICRNAFKNEIKIYTNYYLNEITYLIKKKMYLFSFQSFKFFAEYFDMIYYFNEYNGKNTKQNYN